MTTTDLSGQVAIVTGGAGALGRVIVTGLLEAGVRVAVPVRPGIAPDLAHDPLLTYIACDLTVEGDVNEAVTRVSRTFGRIDILVNAAGGYAGGRPLEEVPVSEWDDMLAVNLRTAFLMTRSVLPVMKRQGHGSIVAIAAAAGTVPGPRHAPYAVAKRGVIALVESIAAELEGSGINANAIAPSTIDTPANRAAMPSADRSRWVRPETIAKAVLFLCSPAGRGISGSTLRVTGTD